MTHGIKPHMAVKVNMSVLLHFQCNYQIVKGINLIQYGNNLLFWFSFVYNSIIAQLVWVIDQLIF